MDKISWQTQEYVHKPKNQDWFWTVGIISAAATVTSIIFGNILFALVIVAGVFVLMLHAVRRPEVIHVEVNNRGVMVNKNLYLFESLKSFSLDEHQTGDVTLVLRSEKLFVPIIMLPTGETDTETLRSHLLKHLKEEPYEETFTGHVTDWLGL